MANKRFRVTSLMALVGMLLALVAACGPAAPTPSPEQAVATTQAEVQAVAASYALAATAWDLDYFFGPPDQPMPLIPDSRATVVYFWDRYGGFDGCNWFLGVFSANSSDGSLRMQMPARTPNICEPAELFNQANLYFTTLPNVTEYRIEEGQLIADTVQDQRLLTYNPAKVLPMLGTEWVLALWWKADPGQWMPAVPAVTTSITFEQGGQASGSGGCSSYSVPYEGDLQIEKVMEATDTYAELPTVTFGPVAAQFVACEEPEGIMDQEQAYFTALGSVAYYFKLGGMLLMLDSDGTPLMMLGARS